LASNLSPVSKMVYDQTAMSFRYPTPDTPSQSPPPNGQQVTARASAPPKASPLAPKPESLKPSTATPKNKHAHAQNEKKIEIVLPTKSQRDQAASLLKSSASPTVSAAVTPVSAPRIKQPLSQQPERPLLSPQTIKAKDDRTLTLPTQPPSKAQKTITVELPSAASFNKSEFLVVPDEPEEPINLSARKRKRDGVDGDNTYGESLDLRQRSDAAYHELKIFLQDAFQADNHAQHTQSDNNLICLTLDNETSLSSQSQLRAQFLLSRAINLNCFSSAPLDDLLRLQRLCDSALKQVESVDFKIEVSWNASDAEQWLQQLPTLELAIRAARTSLMMMCGGREDKQLYSENTIERCLSLFKGVTDGIVIPIAELRGSGNAAELFKCLSLSKKKLVVFFNDCQKLFALMSTMISKVDTSGTVTGGLEYAATQLVFMETAHSEKDSVIDTQKFDGLRLAAMDMLSQIFLLNPTQRQGIFDDILGSLEKLPLGKRARTFKLVDGTSIQPVSALIMRLVQTSAGRVDDVRQAGRSAALQSLEDGAEGVSSSINGAITSLSIGSEEIAASQHGGAIKALTNIAKPLMETARRNAHHVIQYMVTRALNSTKSGDNPYRNLLDLFVEDFTLCLDNPDWPAAEMLLQQLMFFMHKNLNEKAVPAKNMALEVFGIIGAAISKLRGHVRRTAGALDARDADELGLYLTDLASSALEQKSRPQQMVAWVGPYRATLEYLQSRFAEDPHLASAITFIVSDWANKVSMFYEGCDEDEDHEERDQELGRLAYRLREMTQDRQWLSSQFSFKEVSVTQARLSYATILLRSPLCEAFGTILRTLLNSMASDQPTVRSKSLKSVNQVLETDPSILDGDSVVIPMILRCSSDMSTQVRDSALGLIGKCIGMRPALDESMIETVVERFSDAGPGVRKRAMKLAKDIYLRNSNKVLRSRIASGLLHRVHDPEESVQDLARQMIEEIWFSPFHNGENSAISQTSLADHVSLMVQTVRQGGISVTTVLEKVLHTLLAPESKSAQASLEVCKKLVAGMFELIDNEDSTDPSVPSSRDVLQVLVIFAKAEASLFTFEQLCLLKPVIQSISSSLDLATSKYVVVVYRRVLPQLSTAHQQFLIDVRGLLLPTFSVVPRSLLEDIVPCTWIISTLLNNFNNISRLLKSALEAVEKLRRASDRKPLELQATKQLIKYTLIIGMIGKHCQLDGHLGPQGEALKTSFPRWNGDSVSKLMVDTVLPLANPKFSLEVRKQALDSVGLVCESSPRNFASPNVYTTFQQVFDSQTPDLEGMVLRSFRDFLLAEEKRSEQDPDTTALNRKSDKRRELTVIGGTNYDDVASATTSRFLKEIIRIAMSSEGDHAFLAVEVLASINRQGLVHPKETGVTFITLETSSHPKISEYAFSEHRRLHAKHETVVEREYVKALQSAFTYQRDVAKDPRGATTNPFAPKLHQWMEVLKVSRSKNRQKFLEKLCVQIDFDVSKLDVSGDVPHAQYAQFIVENIAFFEYLTVGELHTIVSAMEKLVTSTGATVAQAIESEVYAVRMDALDLDAAEASAQMSSNVTPNRLRQLAAGSMILLAVWDVRTYLRKLYSMGTNSKTKSQAKDLSKAPLRLQGVTGDKLWEDLTANTTALASPERMMKTLHSLVELMNVDKEFLVPDGDDEMNGEDPATPSMDEEDDADEPSAGRGRKRKASGNTPGGRKKRARSSSQQPRKRGRPKKVVADDPDADGEFDDWA